MKYEKKMANVFLMMSKLLDTMELMAGDRDYLLSTLLNNHWKKSKEKRFVFCLI